MIIRLMVFFNSANKISLFRFQIVATVLKLGNLNFVPVTNMDGTEGCRIENEYELYDVGELVKVEVDCLRSSLLARYSPFMSLCQFSSKGRWPPVRKPWYPTSLPGRLPVLGMPCVAQCTPDFSPSLSRGSTRPSRFIQISERTC